MTALPLFFLGSVDVRLDRLLKAGAEHITTGGKDLEFAGLEDVAGRSRQSQIIQLADEGDGPLDRDPLRLCPVFKCADRHDVPSLADSMLTPGKPTHSSA